MTAGCTTEARRGIPEFEVIVSRWYPGFCIPDMIRKTPMLPFALSSNQAPDLLAFVGSVLSSCGQARKHDKRGVSTPLWDYQLPGSRAAAEMLRKFVAAAGRLTVDVNGLPAGWIQLAGEPPIVASNGLELRLQYSLLGRPIENYLAFSPFPSRAISQLCHKEWAEFGFAQVGLPGSLLPEMQMDGETAVLTWDKPPQLRLRTKGFFGLWRRLTHTTIEAIRIGPDSGEIVTTGLAGWTLPRLIWA